jgi:nicotinate phosphoribosyltransferase
VPKIAGPLVSDLDDRMFWLPTEEEIKSAITTDVYFEYARDALKFARVNPRVTMEVFTRKNPFGARWAVACGIYEVAKLLQGLPVDVDAMEEGEIFLTDPNLAVNEPIMRISGRYQDLAVYENPILGFLSQSSGICTKAARVSQLAQGKLVISFGTRRVHPALAALVERCSYIGGVTSISNVLGARLMKKQASGTMPHAFILCIGDEVRAWKIFDRALPANVPRIALVDTLSDEKLAAIKAYEAFGKKLYGVRLDTPSSRRGDMRNIVQEVKWELAIRHGENVKVIVSGGIDEADVLALRDCVDGFGIGGSISAAPIIDFCDKIVEIEGDRGKRIFRAKRGDLGGRKNVFRNLKTFEDIVTVNESISRKGYVPLLKPLLREGRIVRSFTGLEKLRGRTAKLVSKISKLEPTLRWE